MARLHRRNFLPAFILNLALWVSTILIIIFLDPSDNMQFAISNWQLRIFANIILFFLSLTLALTLTFALLFANTRRGLFLALFVSLVLFLRLEKLASWWNIILLFGVLLCLELYISKKSKNPPPLNLP